MNAIQFRQPNATDDEPSRYKEIIDSAVAVLKRLGASFAPYAEIILDIKPSDINIDTNTIHKEGHNFLLDDVVRFASDDVLFGGVIPDTDYHVIADEFTEDSFKISDIQGGAPIEITDPGSGLHEVELIQGMRVRVTAGLINFIDAPPLLVSSKASELLITPVSNPRIDLIVLSSIDGILTIVKGDEAAVPEDPAMPEKTFVVGRIFLYVGMTEISNNDIEDIRTFAVSAGRTEAASESVAGVVLLTTMDEALKGENDSKAVTPYKLKEVLEQELYSPPEIGAIDPNTGRFTSLEADSLKGNIVDSDNLKDNSIYANHLAPGSVGADAIIAGGVGTDELHSNIVTQSKMVNGSIGQAQLKTTTVSITGRIIEISTVQINLQPYSWFPMIYSELGVYIKSLGFSGSADQPGFALYNSNTDTGTNYTVNFRHGQI